MPLHRRIPVALAMPEADPSLIQAAPVFVGSDLVEPIKIHGGGTLLWWAVGKNGDTPDAVAVDGTGASFDARLVIRWPSGPGVEYLGFTPISVTFPGPLPWGHVAIDRDIPDGATGWIILSALTAAGPATHLWVSYHWVRGGGTGV